MLSKLKLNSLKKKISLSIIIIIVLCAIVSAFIVNLVVEYQMAGQYRAEKEAAIESLTYSLKPILDSHDYQQVGQATYFSPPTAAAIEFYRFIRPQPVNAPRLFLTQDGYPLTAK